MNKNIDSNVKDLPPIACACGGSNFGTHGLLDSGKPRWRCNSCGTRDQSKFTFLASVTKVATEKKVVAAESVKAGGLVKVSKGKAMKAPKPIKEKPIKLPKEPKSRKESASKGIPRPGKLAHLLELLSAPGARLLREDLYNSLVEKFGENPKMHNTIGTQLCQARIGDDHDMILCKEKDADGRIHYWVVPK